MTPRERVLTALNCREPDRVPFVDYFDEGIKRKIMGTDQSVDEAEFALRIGMDAIYNVDYITPVFTNASHGKGGSTSGANNQGVEFIGEGIIRKEGDISKIILPDTKKNGYWDSAKRFIDKYGDSDLGLYATIRPFGMFNVIFSMPLMDFSIALKTNQSLLKTMMTIFLEFNAEVVENLQTIGFEFFMCCNDMAFKTAPFVSPTDFREFFIPQMEQIADLIKIPWIFHSDGDLTLVMDDLLTLGMNGMNPFEPLAMDINHAKETWGDRICLTGNIDLVHTLPHGTVEEVETEVKQRIKKLAPGGGYICASANSITDYCKPENVIAMGKAIKKYGKYPIQIEN